MIGLMLTFSLFTLGFEGGGGVNYEKSFSKDLDGFPDAVSWGAELGARDILPGIGFDLGMRRFGIEKTVEEDSLEKLMRWESYFFDATAVFESWPYLKGPFGLRLRLGPTYAPWRMLADGEVVSIPPQDTLSDTLYMEAGDWGILLGGSVMIRPVKFIILDIGVNHRHIFSLDTLKFGVEDADERFMEVYIAARFRF